MTLKILIIGLEGTESSLLAQGKHIDARCIRLGIEKLREMDALRICCSCGGTQTEEEREYDKECRCGGGGFMTPKGAATMLLQREATQYAELRAERTRAERAEAQIALLQGFARENEKEALLQNEKLEKAEAELAIRNTEILRLQSEIDAHEMGIREEESAKDEYDGGMFGYVESEK